MNQAKLSGFTGVLPWDSLSSLKLAMALSASRVRLLPSAADIVQTSVSKLAVSDGVGSGSRVGTGVTAPGSAGMMGRSEPEGTGRGSSNSSPSP